MRKKKKRTYNGRVFKARRAYSFAEIAEKLNIHIRTVQVWRKEGLSILEDNTKPFLVMGQDLRDFLKARCRRRKKPLEIGEFYCTRCRCPRKSRPEDLTKAVTGRKLGPTFQQLLIRGVCEECGQSLLLFSSDRKAAEWVKNGLLFMEPQKLLNGNGSSSVNTDILKGRKHGKNQCKE